MRKEKQLLLDEVTDKVTGDRAWILASYKNLTANGAGDFRKRLREAGGELEVVRKRLLMKAAASAGIELERTALEGHLAVIIAGEDPVGATKATFAFAKETDTVEVLGGKFEGTFHTAENVKRIAELPSRDEMRAQLLGTLEAPMSQTLAVMEALLTAVPHCLQNKSQ
jgi:large subunit ribosomal protein L10